MERTSKEDYLRTIYSLFEQKQQQKDNGIKAIDIAKNLSVSKPSVSEMIKKLTKEGFLEAKPYSNIFLTKKGMIEAKRIISHHRIIEVFLKEILKYDIKDVHEEAHRLEHAFSQESINRLDKFLGNPKLAPSGYSIPRNKRQ